MQLFKHSEDRRVKAIFSWSSHWPVHPGMVVLPDQVQAVLRRHRYFVEEASPFSFSEVFVSFLLQLNPPIPGSPYMDLSFSGEYKGIYFLFK